MIPATLHLKPGLKSTDISRGEQTMRADALRTPGPTPHIDVSGITGDRFSAFLTFAHLVHGVSLNTLSFFLRLAGRRDEMIATGCVGFYESTYQTGGDGNDFYQGAIPQQLQPFHPEGTRLVLSA
jgi:hypothetical protein